MTLPIISGDRDIIRENYVLLANELDSTLSLENVGELFAPESPSDLLGALMVKIDSAKQYDDLDFDTANELNELEEEIFNSIRLAFGTEFPELADLLYTEFNDISQNPLIEFIYKFFYIKRRELCLNFLVERVLTKRSTLVKAYKTAEIKKDLSYQTAKSEMKELKNSEYYVLLMSAGELVEDILGDDSLTYATVLGYTDMEEEELEISDILCNNLNGTTAMTNIYQSLVNSEYLDEFKATFKNRLFNRLVNLN